jgi:hypothetical protein
MSAAFPHFTRPKATRGQVASGARRAAMTENLASRVSELVVLENGVWTVHLRGCAAMVDNLRWTMA